MAVMRPCDGDDDGTTIDLRSGEVDVTRKCKVWRQTLDLNTTRYWMDMRWMDDDMLVLAVVWMDVDVGEGTVQLDASAIEPDFFFVS
ncbi:hypothetical protein OsI_32543 [Oryza sativa Indica Group]|uniref:Uncharacterized protein n=1 Tax=Oryza sativa subsp. indica TaxID=39946 RepID=A2Z4G3_ORYSI|nr:hypothetical protein OsI_32543 [Oryza sativa Indica Group]